MNTPDFEHQIGIEAYCTPESGVGGKLRVRIDDFEVLEQFLYPTKKETGQFTIAEVTARNWETHTLVQEIAHKLHCSQRRISFAGTKDKRAKTTQLMSFQHIPPEQLALLHIRDVDFQKIYQSESPVRIGDLIGNTFTITLRNINSEVTQKKIKNLLTPIESNQGYPNFYGIQRFGIIRPITHLVGKHIIQGDFKNAVMTYIAHPMDGEKEETYLLRQELQRTQDFTKAFHSYPDSLNFEKAILNKLIQDPDDYVAAIQQLPRNLLLMFVNAYESFLFNKILSERIKRKIPLHQAILGDIIAPVKNNIMTTDLIEVTAANIEKVNHQLVKKKAVVTGLLIGSDTMAAKGEMGEIEQQVLESENVNPRDFIIPDIPYLSSSGTRRGLFAFINNLTWTLRPDELYEEKQALHLQFTLQKGCYATSFLREIMKSNDPKNY